MLIFINKLFAGTTDNISPAHEPVLLNWTDNTLVLELVGPSLSLEQVEMAGDYYQVPRVGDWPTIEEEGKPRLPFAGVAIAVPLQKRIDGVQVNPVRTESFRVERIAATAKIVPQFEDDLPYPGYEIFFDRSVYDANTFYPATPYQLTSLGRLAGIQVVQLALFPARYNPVSGELEYTRHLQIEVRFSDAVTRPRDKNLPQVQPEQVEQLCQLVVNKAQILQALTVQRPGLLKSVSPTIAKPALQIWVNREGIYRLTRQELENANVPISSIDPKTLHLTNRGIDQAIYVAGADDGRFDTNDYLDFYGVPNHGDTSFYDIYQDENVYWLGWGDSAGTRVRDLAVLSPQGAAVPFYFDTVHLEQENIYYSGDDDLAIWNTEAVSGEGWIWHIFFAKDEYTATTSLKNIYFAALTGTIRIRVRGTTFNQVSPDHHFRFYLNDHLLGEQFFNDRESITFSTDFQTQWLNAGANRIKIHSVGDTDAPLDQCYLDWIEIQYPHSYRTDTDLLIFQPVQTGLQHIVIDGFKNDSIAIYDLNQANRLTGFQMSNDVSVVIAVSSAGSADGNFAEIIVNGAKIISGGQRGLNVVFLNPKTAVVELAKVYDTYLSPEQADSLAAQIERAAPQTPVLLAVKDEASKSLTDRLRSALRSLGSSAIDSLGYKDSFALIGQKGLLSGQAREVWNRAGRGAVSAEDTIILKNTGQNYQISFAAEISSEHRYAVCSAAGVLKPVKMSLRQPGSLLASGTGADYIIITHEKFLAAANLLAQFRASHNGLRTLVVEIQDVYDDFNHGLKNPGAIRDFLAHARENWPAPAPQYLCLFGDASWDHKLNGDQHTKIDFVPSYGAPVSDTWFVCLDGDDDILPDLNVGRIPVETETEAYELLQKLEAYETQEPDSWHKRLLFIAGGLKASEHRDFENQNQNLINRYVTPVPLAGVGDIISKGKYETSELSAAEAIIKRLNEGRLWLNFIGHGASSTWDLIFNDSNIQELNNPGRLPFITSMTCHTARFANPGSTSFGEEFLRIANRGCIGFWGTTGWGFVDQDKKIIDQLFKTVFKDTTLETGSAITVAKTRFAAESWINTRTISTLYQFTLLGDPALKLALPNRPELVLRNDAMQLQPAIATEADSVVQVNLRIWNYGLATTDSVAVSGRDVFDNRERIGIFGSYKTGMIGYRDSLLLNWPIYGTVGRHLLHFEVNPTGQIPEVTMLNNLIEVPVDIFPSGISISQPYQYQMVPTNTPRLVVNNPAEQVLDRVYYFEVDTVTTFNSPFLLQSGPISQGLLVTRWQTTPIQTANELFWRCRYFAGGDYSNWAHSSFYLVPIHNTFDWQQQGSIDFMENTFFNTTIDENGHVTQAVKKALVKAESQGLYLAETHADISLNGTSVLVPSRGHNLAVFDPATGDLLHTDIFDTWNSAMEADRMATYISQLPSGRVVAIAIRDEGSRSMTEAAYQALESIGSQYCRQVGYHDSWAIVGRKGAVIGTVSEQWLQVGTGIAVAQDTLFFLPDAAHMISPVIGPAGQWHAVKLALAEPSFPVVLNIMGYNKTTAQWDTLKRDLLDQEVSLNDISAEAYPKIKLRANFVRNQSSQVGKLLAWHVDYESVPDLAIGNPSVTLNRATLIEGEKLEIAATILNVGAIVAKNFKVEFLMSDPDSGKIPIGTAEVVATLPPDSSVRLTRSWNSLHNSGHRQLYIHVDPADAITELFEINNSYVTTIIVNRDTIQPRITVTFDGREIIYGDYVATRPEIIACIHDNSPVPIVDTSMVRLLLDGVTVAHNSGLVRLEPYTAPKENHTGIVSILSFTPTLTQGDHTLELFVTDANNNRMYRRDYFRVETDMQLTQVLNYPNPFEQDTWFSFYLTQPADALTIKIYTIAGRLIQSLQLSSLAPGYHKIHWDGLDADGDELANGLYLYRIAVTGPAGSDEEVGRVVVMK